MSAVLEMGRADGVIAVTTANVAELVGEVRRLQGVLVEIIERLEYGQIAEPHAIACAAIGLGDRKTPDHDLFFLEAMAFREALENYACPGIGKCPERVMDDGTCIKETTGGCGNAAAGALADYPLRCGSTSCATSTNSRRSSNRAEPDFGEGCYPQKRMDDDLATD